MGLGGEGRVAYLEAQDLRLDQREGLAVDLDEALAGSAVRDSGRGLLLAEALHALGCLSRHNCGVRRTRRALLGESKRVCELLLLSLLFRLR